ncbi:MAG: hypothetical protein Q9227_005517 [Pyrenula ochraceoflavens]
MSKRAVPEDQNSSALKSGARPPSSVNGDNDQTLDYEDDYEDEFESEDEIFEAGVDGRPDEESAQESKDAMEIDSGPRNISSTFIPGRSQLQPGLSLTPDPSTYEMLHTLSTPWPCLSFSIVRDNLGSTRTSYPRTLYAVSGTQASTNRPKDNELLILKLSNLSKMEKSGNETSSSSSKEDSDDEDTPSEPILESRSIPLPSTTNRIRAFQPSPSPLSDPTAMPPTITATSLELSPHILIHDITSHLTSLSSPGRLIPPDSSRPLSTLRCHQTEGYALDWAPPTSFPHGRLLSGDNAGHIYSTSRTEGGSFSVDTRPLLASDPSSATPPGSIEELQWSPSERNVFASAGSDGCVRVWDVRSKSRRPALSVKVSNTDVNVMSWSNLTTHLLATGADDGRWGVWDLRQWKSATPSTPSNLVENSSPVASFNFHRAPITSIEWHPSDDSVVAVACADGTATLWDLAVELDDEEQYSRAEERGLVGGEERVPPQLLFIHHVKEAKECHWHPQMAGTVMTTGEEGFGVLKTISV